MIAEAVHTREEREAGAEPVAPAVPDRGPAGVRLVVEGLRKSYGGTPALRGVSFETGEGVTGLLGPNGAGKTTLMHCVVGISGWDAGRVVVNGVDAEPHARAARRMVGFMPERVSFPSEMRVEPYLRFVAAAKGIPRPGREAAVSVALTRAGLDGSRSRILANLSKGYRQRVGLAQALLGEPPVVILDEPTAGLDPLSVLDVRKMLSGYAAEHVVVLSTHALAEARLLCDRLIVLGSGSIVYDGPTTAMTADAAGAEAHQVRLRLRAGHDPDDPDALVAAAGARVVRSFSQRDRYEAVVDVDCEEAIGALARHLMLGGWAVLALEPTSDALEEAFRRAVLAEGRPG